MGFFEDNKNNNTPIEPIDLLRAKQLYETFTKARLLSGPARIKTWANEFRLLRNQIEEERITNSLIWFCEHPKDEYTPKISSAAGFRNKFIQIEAAMYRAVPAKAATQPCAAAVKLSTTLALRWPTPNKSKTHFSTKTKAQELLFITPNTQSGRYNVFRRELVVACPPRSVGLDRLARRFKPLGVATARQGRCKGAGGRDRVVCGHGT